nr:alpha/beta hydrolase [Mycobacterium branderi]
MFVAGGMHGGWCWKRVTDRLRARGHDVFAPTLTGLAERAHLLSPAVNLETHIADIVGVLDRDDLRDVILVGHSYGGMVITAVADRAPQRLARLVYLDAFWPEDGETVADIVGEEDCRRTVMATRTDSASGPVIAGAVATQIAQGCGVIDPDDVAWVTSKLTPQPAASMTQPLKLERTDVGVPVLFVSCRATRYDGLQRCYVRAKTRAVGDPRVRTLEIDAPHDAMITHPDLVTDLLTTEDLVAG